jgi:hypothetical protein
LYCHVILIQISIYEKKRRKERKKEEEEEGVCSGNGEGHLWN